MTHNEKIEKLVEEIYDTNTVGKGKYRSQLSSEDNMLLNQLIRDNTKLSREGLTDLLTERLSNYTKHLKEVFLSEVDIDKLGKLPLPERMVQILHLIEPNFNNITSDEPLVVMPNSEVQKLMIFKRELMAIRDANKGSIGEEKSLDDEEIVKRAVRIYNEEITA